jgi:hypothetical protein
MQRSQVRRAAGAVTAAVVAGVLAAPQPAGADIAVDSAVCLSNASGTLTSPNPVIPADPVIPPVPLDPLDYPLLNWQATIQTTYCRAANASLLLVRPGGRGSAVANPGSRRAFDPGLYVLRVRTSLGSKDLASIMITQG